MVNLRIGKQYKISSMFGGDVVMTYLGNAVRELASTKTRMQQWGYVVEQGRFKGCRGVTYLPVNNDLHVECVAISHQGVW